MFQNIQMRDSLRAPRYTSRILSIVLLLAFLLTGAAPPAHLPPANPTQAPNASQELLQFRAGEHVLGFQADRVYFAALDHLVSIQFLDTPGVIPHSSQAASSSGATAMLDQVSYRELWPGITVQYQAAQTGIAKVTYQVALQADPGSIRLRYNVPVSLQADGSLRLELKSGFLSESAPLAWQEIDGQRQPVAASFALVGGVGDNQQEVGFHLGSYDQRHPLMIDPTYEWHTFYGGRVEAEAHAIFVTSDTWATVTGRTKSQWITGSPGCTGRLAGGYDIFIAHIPLSASAISTCRLYGGSSDDSGEAVVRDSSFNVLVTGYTDSTWNGPGDQAPDHAYSGAEDIFVLKLDSNSDYLTHGFYGSTSRDMAWGLAVKSDRSVVVTGASYATWNGPDGQAPLDGYSDDSDMVVIGLDSSAQYSWHAFYGAGYLDEGTEVTVDASDNIYVAGVSEATWKGPGSVNPLHAHSGGDDITVLKLTSAGAYTWHTFYGSSNVDRATSIAISGSNLYVGGHSNATWNGSGGEAPKHTHTGGSDLAVLALNTAGAYQWHTFFGSSSTDYGHDLAVADDGSIYLVGQSNASWTGSAGQLPLHAHSGGEDLTALKLNSAGVYQWHTFYGSIKAEIAYGADTATNDLVLAGFGDAPWPGFETVEQHYGREVMFLRLGSAGSASWLRFLFCESKDDKTYQIIPDGSGGAILVGESYFSWRGPANQAPIHAHSIAASRELFALKLDSVGNYQWHTFYGPIALDSLGATRDNNGNIYIAGTSIHSWTGDGGAPPLNPFNGSGGAYADMFLLKLNSSGVYQWHTFYGSPGSDVGVDVASQGAAAYLTGNSDTSWNGPSGQSPLHAHQGDDDLVVIKLSSAGAYQWHTFYGSASYDLPGGIAMYAYADIYITGYSGANWQGPTGQNPIHAYTSGSDLFVLKLNSSGVYQWHTFYDGYGTDIAMDPNGDPVITGYSYASWLGDDGEPPLNNPSFSGFSNAVILKLTSSGVYQWHTFYGAAGSNEHSENIAVDLQGFIYVAGVSRENWQGPASQPPLHAYSGYDDIFLLTLNSDGNYWWHTFYGSSASDWSPSVGVDTLDNLWLAGTSYASWLGDGNAAPLHGFTAGSDAFVLRFDNPIYKLHLPLVRR